MSRLFISADELNKPARLTYEVSLLVGKVLDKPMTAPELLNRPMTGSNPASQKLVPISCMYQKRVLISRISHG